MVGYDIHRTENLDFNENSYTIRFAANKDRTDFAMFVSNETFRRQKKYHFSEETADAFQHQTGNDLHSTEIGRAHV